MSLDVWQVSRVQWQSKSRMPVDDSCVSKTLPVIVAKYTVLYIVFQFFLLWMIKLIFFFFTFWTLYSRDVQVSTWFRVSRKASGARVCECRVGYTGDCDSCVGELISLNLSGIDLTFFLARFNDTWGYIRRCVGGEIQIQNMWYSIQTFFL